MFVVFRTPAQETSRTLPKVVETQLATLGDTWNVSFQLGRDAPASVKLDKLTSWTNSADKSVGYFSGTGMYSQTIHASADWFRPGAKLWIDVLLLDET